MKVIGQKIDQNIHSTFLNRQRALMDRTLPLSQPPQLIKMHSNQRIGQTKQKTPLL